MRVPANFSAGGPGEEFERSPNATCQWQVALRNALTLLAALTLTLGSPLAAQGPEAPPCGELENKQFFLERNLRHFTQADLSALREEIGIQQLSEDVSRRVVETPRECGRIFGRVTSHLARKGELKTYRKTGFRHAIFRYGPFYAILVFEKPQSDSPETISTGYGQFLNFRASDLEYVSGIAD